MKSLKIIATTIIGIAIIFVGVDYFSVTSAYWRYYRWDIFKWNVVFKNNIEKSVKTTIAENLKLPAKPLPSKEGSFPDSPYVFSLLSFYVNIPDWENHLKELKGKPNIHALEIGSFEGFSAIWQLENILTHPTSTITCIDIFDDKTVEGRFDRNIEATGIAHKVKKLKGSSEKMLRSLNEQKYDYVYIDACHLAKWVLSDAVLSWDLVKPGGLIIFDDYGRIPEPPKGYKLTRIKFIDEYLWKKKERETSPEPAIDAFINIYKPYLEVVFKRWQVVVRKKLE